MANGAPQEPKRVEPSKDWEHYALWQHVRDALYSIPIYFKTETNIEGMLAQDINALNTALGATIEDQVVKTLNSMRAVWDPDKKYPACSFVRQSQCFPDVLFRKKGNGQGIIMGIELKGWYLLAKEGMSSLRFSTTPAACAPADLIVVVPWVLSNVLAGPPIVFPPFIELAGYAAEMRNYYWQHKREAKGKRGVTIAQGVKPYPKKADKISDAAEEDGGGNFGRLARYGIMDSYISEMSTTSVRGVSAKEWATFFRDHARTEEAN